MGRRICGGGRRTSRRSLCVRESSSRSVAKEEKKKRKVLIELRQSARERKREGGYGMKWKVEGKKKGEDGDNGYTCVVEKNQEKRKRKGNVWMIERKKGKIQFRNATTIFSQ